MLFGSTSHDRSTDDTIVPASTIPELWDQITFMSAALMSLNIRGPTNIWVG